jgi:hypothetical protein
MYTFACEHAILIPQRTENVSGVLVLVRRFLHVAQQKALCIYALQPPRAFVPRRKQRDDSP